MSKKKVLKSVEGLSKENLEDILEEVGIRADVSSDLIYVYSYTSKVFSRNATSNKSMYSKSKKYNQGNPKSGVAKTHNYKYKSMSGAAIAKESKTSYGVSSERWAVRLEGRTNPVNKVFLTKVEAKKYAENLKQQGKGKKIVIVD